MSKTNYKRIQGILDSGRRKLLRAKLTAGTVRLVSALLVTAMVLVLWALATNWLRFFSVPAAWLMSILGAGALAFILVRWVVWPWLRLPDRDDFAEMVDRRHPDERNLVVNAYQLGKEESRRRHPESEDIIDALVDQASERIENLDVARWRNRGADRPWLWAAGTAVLVFGVLAVMAPAKLTSSLQQALNPSLAEPPPVGLQVNPGDVQVIRGGDVPIEVEVEGTGKTPEMLFRERHGDWRRRSFAAHEGSVNRDGGKWHSMLMNVDRTLEYKVVAPRAESQVFTVHIQEPPRISAFRTHLTYPAYTRLPAETIQAPSGDVASLMGTQVELHIVTNVPVEGGSIEWRNDAGEETQIELESVDSTTWRWSFPVTGGGSYRAAFVDKSGEAVLESPRFRVDPVLDRAPFLTLHLPQEDHDLYEDMMERIVADAADDFGFSDVRVVYQVDDGPKNFSQFHPFTAGQKEFRLDTLWDISGIPMLPGQVMSFYLEVRDNDTVTGPKMVRSDVRRIRFPSVAELYEEVAQEHDQEIDTLSKMQEEQADLRERMEKLQDDLKQDKDIDWEVEQELKDTLTRQQELEQQLSEVSQRLQDTLQKAEQRAGMDQQLVQKMSELNEILNQVASDDMRRAFQRLSDALSNMREKEMRNAMEELQDSQEQMLAGLDRTIELLKQVRKEEQVEDVVRRSEEIAQLQEEIAKELEKMGGKPPETDALAENQDEEQDGENAEDAENAEGENPGNQPENQPEKGENPTDPSQQQGEQKPEQSEQPQGEQQESGETESSEQQMPEQASEMTPEMKELMKEIDDLKKQIAEEAEKLAEKRKREQAESQKDSGSRNPNNKDSGNQGSEKSEQEKAKEQQEAQKQEQMKKDLEELLEQLKQAQEQQQSEMANNQAQQNQEQSEQQQSPQGQQQQSDQQQEGGEQDQQQKSDKANADEKKEMEELAEKQEQVKKLAEELRRQLEMLKKLNQEDSSLAQDIEKMNSDQDSQDMEQNMQQAAQSMMSGQKQESTKYAFEARDQANSLMEMAQDMQQNMQAQQQEDNTAMMEAIIQGLIDVSRAEETLALNEEGADRELAARQYDLAEVAEAWADSLAELSRESFAIQQDQTSKLGSAISRMHQATRNFDLGNTRGARHEGRESASDLNEMIVELMQSHAQMCQGSGSGSQMQQMMQKMQGLSEGQQQVNQQTDQMGSSSGERLSMSQRQRMEWLAAQQERIRQGLQQVQEEFSESRELLGDMDTLTEEMEEVEAQLRDKKLDQRLLERQQKILSRLLDAQRSIRQQEMSPERESRSGTLAQRQPPPPIPDGLLGKSNAVEQDLLRGARDVYPAQYRRLVENYFKALSKEQKTP